jgi:ABC-type multidrug transport system ATPase subunit
MKNTLTISSLHKKFGETHAVNDIPLQVKNGNVYGLPGPNGSGKTAISGTIHGLVNVYGGSYCWFNEPNLKKGRGKELINIQSQTFSFDFQEMISAVDAGL